MRIISVKLLGNHDYVWLKVYIFSLRMNVPYKRVLSINCTKSWDESKMMSGNISSSPGLVCPKLHDTQNNWLHLCWSWGNSLGFSHQSTKLQVIYMSGERHHSSEFSFHTCARLQVKGKWVPALPKTLLSTPSFYTEELPSKGRYSDPFPTRH